MQALDDDGLADGQRRATCWLGTKLAASPGFAGRQTDTGEEIEIEFTPDNQSLVFAATTNRNAAAYAFTDSQLFVAERGGGEPRADHAGHGQLVAAALHARWPHAAGGARRRRAPSVYNASRLAAFSWPDPGKPRIVTDGLDRVGEQLRGLAGFAHGVLHGRRRRQRKVVLGAHRRRRGADAVRRRARAATPTSRFPTRAGNALLYANWESASAPGEIALITPQNGKAAGAHQVQRRARRAARPAAIENFWFTSSRGKRIHSFIVRPPGFDAAKKYPLFVVIHGGPHGMWRDQFFVRWNYHLLAAPGYVLLLTNYSGSTGFGEEFARSIQGDPLKGPADEINEAADAAIRQFRFIDGSRQCAGGASYGGHLANWLQGTTTRYKCLVSHAGLVNLEAQWGTSDTIYSREVNLGGPPWEQAPVWREQNPIRYAAKFRTPVLVTVGENDFRVPLNNSLEYWSALQRMQVPSRLIVFPDENHWIQKGEDSRLFYAEIAAWLDRWLKPGKLKRR